MERRIDPATGAIIERKSIYEIDPSTPRRPGAAQSEFAVPFAEDVKGEVLSEQESDDEQVDAAPA
jgi:hypothetical protein